MKHLLVFCLFLTLFTAFSCSDRNNLSSEQLNSFEAKLTAPDYFWQSRYGSYIDYQFRADGIVYALINGKNSARINGKWAFDNTSGELQIAWDGGRQYASMVTHIEADWSKITFASKIHEYGDKTITRLRLLDDRFAQTE